MRGSGVHQSEFRPVSHFDEVALSGFGTVNVYVGQAPSVEVTTDDNLLVHVETVVEDGRLTIRPLGPIRPRTGLNVNVGVPQLTVAKVSGAGDVHVHNASGEHLDMSISGAGTMSATGYVQHLSTRISGAGDADMKELVAHVAEVTISGAGDAEVFALDSLNANVSGAGDVTCYGSPPHVVQNVSGAGDIELCDHDDEAHLSISDARSQAHGPMMR
ncbi:MAG: head GIN domain-containing protein [Pirellulaceae bacterium]